MNKVLINYILLLMFGILLIIISISLIGDIEKKKVPCYDSNHNKIMDLQCYGYEGDRYEEYSMMISAGIILFILSSLGILTTLAFGGKNE